MNKDGTEVEMDELPYCDFCNGEAKYDGKTKMGAWAYMCEECFKEYGIGLGYGIGQRLVLRDKVATEVEMKLDTGERFNISPTGER